MAESSNLKTAKMKDVAELAGVSIKTVSRVLNNEPHVQDKLRNKVKEAVAKLDYVPSQSARSLRGNKSYTITLLCHAADSSYINTIQFGAVIACQRLGYQLSISLHEDLEQLSYEQVKAEFEKLAHQHRPDGIMLVAPYAGNKIIAFVLQELGIDVVRIGPVDLPAEGMLVEIDDYSAAIELTQHLIELGHRRIAFVRGLENQRATDVRYAGFLMAMNAAGLSIDDELVMPGSFDFSSGMEAGEKLLAHKCRPTAVFASNDDMAAGLVTAASTAGISVPDDLSVVGFDDSAVATRMRPELTTIHQPLRELGEVAIEKLIDSFQYERKDYSRRVVLDHNFILRNTTAPLKNT